MSDVVILAIESSCDETAAAVSGGFGGGAQLLGPEDVIDQFREHLRPLLAQISAE